MASGRTLRPGRGPPAGSCPPWWRTPRAVHRYDGDDLTEPPSTTCGPATYCSSSRGGGPVDEAGRAAPAVLDSRPSPVSRCPSSGARATVASGVNAGGPSTCRPPPRRPTAPYAGIVAMVADPGPRRQRPVRPPADRYAPRLRGVSPSLAAGAWALSGDPVRAVAVLVVATPCPLIPAARRPSSPASRRPAGGCREGALPLEQPAGAQVLLFDKTGTLTAGHPRGGRGGHGRGRPLERRGCPPRRLARPGLAPRAGVGGGAGRPGRGPRPDPPDGGRRGARSRGQRVVVEGRRVEVGKARLAARRSAPPGLRAVRRRADLDGALTVVRPGRFDRPAGSVIVLDGHPPGRSPDGPGPPASGLPAVV